MLYKFKGDQPVRANAGNQELTLIPGEHVSIEKETDYVNDLKDHGLLEADELPAEEEEAQ